MNRDALVRAIAGVERGPGKRYPAELRSALIQWVSAERDRGRGWSEVALDVDLRPTTLMRWCLRSRAVPVLVRQEAAPSSVTVVTPTGWRIEGLSLEQATAFLGAR